MLRPFPVGSGPRYQPGRSIGQPPAPAPTEEASAAWFGRTPGPNLGNGLWPPFGPRPNPPPPSTPQPGRMPPMAPGALPPPVQLVELAAAYVPFQQFGTICPPGQLPAPGTIFPELARTPPLYRWPPGTDGRV